MRSTDRDYFMSTLAVLQSQRLMIQSISDDMSMRIEEMEDMIAMMYDQQEDQNFDLMVDNAWQSGYDYKMWEEDKVIYDSNRKKECMCDACWDVPSDKYEHRMD
jgi:hypothetical protein